MLYGREETDTRVAENDTGRAGPDGRSGERGSRSVART